MCATRGATVVVAGAAAVVCEASASRAFAMVALASTGTLSGLVIGALAVDSNFLHRGRGGWHKVEKVHKEFRIILVTLYFLILRWWCC